MRTRDGKNTDTGWKTFGSGINIPDPRYPCWATVGANLDGETHESGLQIRREGEEGSVRHTHSGQQIHSCALLLLVHLRLVGRDQRRVA
jgi:hypothetical protein